MSVLRLRGYGRSKNWAREARRVFKSADHRESMEIAAKRIGDRRSAAWSSGEVEY